MKRLRVSRGTSFQCEGPRESGDFILGSVSRCENRGTSKTAILSFGDHFFHGGSTALRAFFGRGRSKPAISQAPMARGARRRATHATLGDRPTRAREADGARRTHTGLGRPY